MQTIWDLLPLNKFKSDNNFKFLLVVFTENFQYIELMNYVKRRVSSWLLKNNINFAHKVYIVLLCE